MFDFLKNLDNDIREALLIQLRNLWFMRDFYLSYPKVNVLRSELSWLYYRVLFT